MANTLRDIALTVGAGSLIVLTTMFGMKQCSCDDKEVVKTETKTPKIEVVNKNNVVVGGNTNVKNNSRVVVGDDIVVENNNDKILRMYKDGMSNVDIAKELGLGVGEVKLVINLFKGA